MALTEKKLDRLLDDACRENPAFLQWLLSNTRFANRGVTYLWSRCDHPWGAINFNKIDPVTGLESSSKRQSETDVLVVVKATDGEPLALHIENKLGAGKFTEDQPQMYAQRAEQWRGKSKYKNYTDYLTILVAPEGFRARYPEQAAVFDKFISHELMAEHLPEFGQ